MNVDNGAMVNVAPMPMLMGGTHDQSLTLSSLTPEVSGVESET